MIILTPLDIINTSFFLFYTFIVYFELIFLIYIIKTQIHVLFIYTKLLQLCLNALAQNFYWMILFFPKLRKKNSCTTGENEKLLMTKSTFCWPFA